MSVGAKVIGTSARRFSKRSMDLKSFPARKVANLSCVDSGAVDTGCCVTIGRFDETVCKPAISLMTREGIRGAPASADPVADARRFAVVCAIASPVEKPMKLTSSANASRLPLLLVSTLTSLSKSLLGERANQEHARRKATLAKLMGASYGSTVSERTMRYINELHITIPDEDLQKGN